MQKSLLNPIIKIFVFMLLFASGTTLSMVPETVFADSTFSSEIEHRSFNNERIEQFKSEQDFNYARSESEQVSFLDLIWFWLWETFIKHLFGEGALNFWDIALRIFAIATIVFIARNFIKNRRNKLFYNSESNGSGNTVIGLDDIHKVNLDELLADATSKKEYRNAIRLLYLISLKKLSEKKMIFWQVGKTNHDYEQEIKQEAIRNSFSQLTNLYEYIWYGDFSVNAQNYESISQKFLAFKEVYKAPQ